ncbi:von Willebrand factor D and EGF domain-containing protein-like [Gigantopelta aegis]|uniref:von Willebrand factor D and EGF domain-containing protein-like n=1 Tax=Gigantopelta aegis TaxID=1735272 RepID=UPI001B88CFF8|nr:von Willebrand factor D and EGF domain-containing protein-like [Gigantopelta aegis]
MNVYVVPSINDVGKSRGLCGKLSNTDTDDFVKRDERQSRPGHEFSESWRVTKNSLFDSNTYNDLKPWDVLTNYCSCPKCDNPPCNTVQCGPMQEVKSCQKNRPSDNTKVIPKRSRCSIHARRKRSVVEHSRDTRQMMSIHKRAAQDWLNGWTKENATVFCQKHFDVSPSTQACRDIPTVNVTKNIDDCVFDIWASGGTDFFDAALDNIQTTCMQEVVMNSTFHQEAGGESVIDKVFKVACPNGCHMKGDCVNGKCRCHANYSGSDCSIDNNSPPALTEVDFEGLCDVHDDSCRAVSVFGGRFVDSPRTKCRFKHVNENGNILDSDVRVLTAQFESLFEVACPIPVHRSKRSALGATAEDRPRAYYVSVSNNGVTYSQEKIVVIYDSTCQTCTLSGTSVKCVTAENYCTLGTKCIPKGGRYPYEGCLVCDINGKMKTWQDDQACRSCMNAPVMWILVVFPAFIMFNIF